MRLGLGDSLPDVQAALVLVRSPPLGASPLDHAVEQDAKDRDLSSLPSGRPLLSHADAERSLGVSPAAVPAGSRLAALAAAGADVRRLRDRVGSQCTAGARGFVLGAGVRAAQESLAPAPAAPSVPARPRPRAAASLSL